MVYVLVLEGEPRDRVCVCVWGGAAVKETAGGLRPGAEHGVGDAALRFKTRKHCQLSDSREG